MIGGEIEAADLASVYRNLELFEGLGIVRHVHLGHGPGLYALAGADEREYLVCERCGEVRAVAPQDLDALRSEIRRAFDFEVRFSHFPITGLCSRCAGEVGLDSGATEEGAQMSHEHDHAEPHSHEHSHGEVTHSHVHDTHEHEHVEHEHEHRHGDEVHSHSHVHQAGLEHEHEHAHRD